MRRLLRRASWFIGLCGSTFACSGQDEAPEPARLEHASPWEELLNWDALPVLGQNQQFRMFTSFDRDEQSKFPLIQAGNKDFNNFIAVCGTRPEVLLQTTDGPGPCEGPEGYLIAAADGPGFVSRTYVGVVSIDSNATPHARVTSERIRIYTDDLSTPAYDVALSDWIAGSARPFTKPLTRWTSDALVSYVPIAYRSKLRIFLDQLTPQNSYYYQVDTQSSRDLDLQAPDGSVAGAAKDPATAVANLVSRIRNPTGVRQFTARSLTVSAGETAPILDLAGPGTIRTLSLVLSDTSLSTLRDLRLTADWDGQATPAIDAPLSLLFGLEQGLQSFETLPMVVKADSTQLELELYLPMPFQRRASLTLTNSGNDLHAVTWRVTGSESVPSARWGYLYAAEQHRTEPFAAGDRYPVARLANGGKYVGTILYMKGRSDPNWFFHHPMNFLEGDPVFTVDGVVSRGTGTEEFFDAGIYFLEGTFDSLFSAVPFTMQTTNPDTGEASMLNWHVLSSAIHFQNSFELSWEYGAATPATASDYRSLAIYYAD